MIQHVRVSENGFAVYFKTTKTKVYDNQFIRHQPTCCLTISPYQFSLNFLKTLNKKIMKKLSIAFVVLTALTITLVSWNTHSSVQSSKVAPAVVINDFGCGMFDGDGGFVFTDNSHAVITSSGNSLLKCSVTGVANSTGKAVHYRDFLCGTFLGLTTDSHEVVSASGNATLTCHVH